MHAGIAHRLTIHEKKGVDQLYRAPIENSEVSEVYSQYTDIYSQAIKKRAQVVQSM